MTSLFHFPPGFVNDPDFVLYVGDVRNTLKALPDESVDCCVTSPPYWGLRDYAAAEQIGLEETPAEYTEALVAVFAEVRRLLKPQGTLWLNLGDTYCHDLKWGGRSGNKNEEKVGYPRPRHRRQSGVKPKDLVGIPWMVAFALREDGWYLRSDIIWAKRNTMPESVVDRPTKSHEYVFLFAKNEHYHFDQDAIREPLADSSAARYKYAFGGPKAADLHRQDAEGLGNRTAPIGMRDVTDGRNARTVWEISTVPYPEAHFATFPLELPRRCVAAGGPAGGTVLDPFMGSGTTALAARGIARKAIGIELNPAYAELCARRLGQQSLLAEAI